MPQSYPLLTLLDARQRAKETAELLLIQHVNAFECAEKRESEVRSRLDVARELLQARAQEQLALAQGGAISALELQAADRHRLAAQLEIARIARQLEVAARATEEHRVALEQARQGAVVARQELAVVERHRCEYLESLSRAEELRADEQAAEVWAAQHDVTHARIR